MAEIFGVHAQLIIDWLIEHPWRSAALAALALFLIGALCKWDGNPDVFERSDPD
jgi:hypothetical protein